MRDVKSCGCDLRINTGEKCISATVSHLLKQIDQVSTHYGINRETVDNQSAIRLDWFHKDSALFDRTVSPDKLSEEREQQRLFRQTMRKK